MIDLLSLTLALSSLGASDAAAPAEPPAAVETTVPVSEDGKKHKKKGKKKNKKKNKKNKGKKGKKKNKKNKKKNQDGVVLQGPARIATFDPAALNVRVGPAMKKAQSKADAVRKKVEAPAPVQDG